MKWIGTHRGNLVNLDAMEVIQISKDPEPGFPFKICIGKTTEPHIISVLAFHRAKDLENSYKRLIKFLGSKRRGLFSYKEIYGRRGHFIGTSSEVK